jgi:hypothetical protein
MKQQISPPFFSLEKMKNNLLNRRQFIRDASLYATSFGWGMMANRLLGQDPEPIEGEEWRRSIQHMKEDLRPRGVVLQEARSNIERHRKGKMLLSIRHKGEVLARQPVEKEEGVRILDRFLSEVETGHEYDMRVKGHPLVWTIPKGIHRGIESIIQT